MAVSSSTLVSEFLRVLTLQDPDGVFEQLKEEVKVGSVLGMGRAG